MERGLTSYPVALSPLTTIWRLMALCAAVLLLAPSVMGQTPPTVQYIPPSEWVNFRGGMASDRANPAIYYATLQFDAAVWGSLTVAGVVGTLSGTQTETVEVYKDGILLGTASSSGTTFTFPVEHHVYTIQIKAKQGTPNSNGIWITEVTTTKRPTDTVPSPTTPESPIVSASQTTNTLIPNQSNSLSSSGSSSLTASDPNLLGQSSSTELSSTATSIPLSNVGQMSGIYSGLGNPPPYTNTFASISDASLTSASEGSSGPNTPAIIGAVFGILIGITLCIFAALCYRRRRNRNRIAPSTAFMNYRSTTEQPPAYQFNRTSFFQRTREGLAGGFGTDSKSGYPHPFAPSAGVAGLGYGATAAGMGAGGRRLMTLDEKSTEGRESALSAPTYGAASYEDQQLLGTPVQANMGGGGGFAGVGAGGGGGSAVAVVVPETRNDPMTSMEGVARTLTPPPSNASDKFGSTSSIDQNPYDGMAPPTPAPGFPTNPFATPPASDSNLAGRGAWSQA